MRNRARLVRALLIVIALAFVPASSDRAVAQQTERDTLIDRARRSVLAAAERAAADPLRPVYHYRPLSNWMNDPNGTIMVNGRFHVFHQFNPYGDGWGNMHWGHAETRDLVHWKHLPIALWPSKAAGEDHVFSGCAVLDAAGRPVLFYTSVGEGRPNQQWTAVPGDDGLLRFSKPRANPVLTTDRPDGLPFGDGMRDPFVFRTDNRTFMVIGADTEDRAVVPLYESTDPDLMRWRYRGVLWSISKDVIAFPECPNFFPLDGRFILLLSPYRAVEYRVGDLDLDRIAFTPVAEGKLDHSEQYYATNIAFDAEGRCILFGWLRGFPQGRGWNGALAVPRILTLDDAGRPVQRPVPAIEKLHERRFDEPPRDLAAGLHALRARGDALHIELALDSLAGSTVILHLRRSEDGERSFPIRIDRDTLGAPGLEAPRRHGPSGVTRLTVLLDRSVVEVFADGGRTVLSRSFVTSQRGDDSVALEVLGGAVRLRSATIWTLKPVMLEADAAALEADGR